MAQSNSQPLGAVVLLSGGLDSAVALAVALRRDGRRCVALSFDYGQRHRHELACAKAVSEALGVPHRVVTLDLRAIGGSALTDEIAVPKGRNEAAMTADIPVTYVPARNLVFLSLAAGLAEVVGAREIYAGVNAVDYSGYPDCRPEFIRSFEQTVNLGTKAGVEGRTLAVRTPLISLSKADIIRLGVELGTPLERTSSCYDPDPSGASCGRCDSCVIRARGFAEAGVPDPTRYVGARA